MFVGFLGAPVSGKTTIAAQVFAELKKKGMPVEFLSEMARLHFATRKYYTQPLPLQITEKDQLDIFERQGVAEKVLIYSVGKQGIVVSDSCSLNSLFYMSDTTGKEIAKEFSDQITNRYSTPNLLYFSEPLPINFPNDPNRVHTLEEAKVINDKMINGLEGLDLSKIVKRKLAGPIEARVHTVLRDIYESYVTLC